MDKLGEKHIFEADMEGGFGILKRQISTGCTSCVTHLL